MKYYVQRAHTSNKNVGGLTVDQIQYMYCTWYSCNKLHDDRGASSQTNTVHASLPVQTYYCTTLVLYEG